MTGPATLPWTQPLACWRHAHVEVCLLAGGAVRVRGRRATLQVGAPSASAGASGSERLDAVILPSLRLVGMAGLLEVLGSQRGDGLTLVHPLPGDRVAALAALWADGWPSGVALTVDGLAPGHVAEVAGADVVLHELRGVETVGGRALAVPTCALSLRLDGVTIAVVPEGGGHSAAARAVANADLAVMFAAGSGPDARPPATAADLAAGAATRWIVGPGGLPMGDAEAH
jgi:hypothetical protein